MAAAAKVKPDPSTPDGFHALSKIMQVNLSEVKVDRSYQRDVSPALVDDIADNWDEVASELVLYSNRGTRDPVEEGGLWIINGQHRTAAAQKQGMKKIWARVVDLSDVEDPGAVEADLRLKTNKRIGDQPVQRFKAQLRAGDPESVAIRDILARYDTQINEVPNLDHGINTVSAVEKIYRTDDGKLLNTTMETLNNAFGVVGGESFNASMMKGVAWFIQRHYIEADMPRLVEKMQNVGPAAMGNRARTIQATMGSALWTNYYRALVEMYNEKLGAKSRLKWKLRGSTKEEE
jgi:hypothetical protein